MIFSNEEEKTVALGHEVVTMAALAYKYSVIITLLILTETLK